MHRLLPIALIIALILAACGGDDSTPQVFQATLPPAESPQAPVYSPTPTLTASPTVTPTVTPTATPSHTPTFTVTPSPTLTPSLTPTTPLLTLTAPAVDGAPDAFTHPTAELTTPEGWSCGDFPCADDIDGFLERMRVPVGYTLSHVGRFPGQPMQIAYGPDGRLYATLLLDGTREGAVFVMDDDGEAERYSQATFVSPIGLAFQPGTDTLYVSARVTLESGGGLWRVLPDGSSQVVLDDLPCCFQVIGQQPNGMVFGPDGYLYLGVGSLTDRAEPPNPESQQYADLHPYEASVLRIQPHTGAVEVYARGIRNPYDVTFDSTGQFYATDNGLLDGPGDRLLAIDAGLSYGWPYWRTRGCAECPPRAGEIEDDLLRFPDYTLPRGLTAYTGTQFPANMFDSLFVALWNAGSGGQRIVRIDPDAIPTNPEALELYQPEPFVTGLIRPVDVVVAPDGSLVVADFIYGNIWRIAYGEETRVRATSVPLTAASGGDDAGNTGDAPLFVTATPRPPD